jgi:hypothetical protein
LGQIANLLKGEAVAEAREESEAQMNADELCEPRDACKCGEFALQSLFEAERGLQDIINWVPEKMERVTNALEKRGWSGAAERLRKHWLDHQSIKR